MTEQQATMQRRNALKIANEMRSAKAAFKREIASMPRQESRVHCAEWLANGFDPDSPLGNLTLSELLTSLQMVGKARANKVAQALQVTPTRRLRDLSDKQVKALAQWFRTGQVRAPGERSPAASLRALQMQLNKETVLRQELEEENRRLRAVVLATLKERS